jgi:hypothetical protein
LTGGKQRIKERWGDPIYLGDSINSLQSDAEPRSCAEAPYLLARNWRVLREMTTWNNGPYNIWIVDLAKGDSEDKVFE